MVDALVLALGMAMLVVGGDVLVRGASGIARRFGIAPIVIGLTVVAFGTSTPELVVNLTAAARGESAIGFGNVVGSNIANIGLLLGITAIVYPLAVHRSVVSREIPMMLLASVAAVVLGLDAFTGGTAHRFARGDGLVLLLLFAIFLYYTIGDALGQRRPGTDWAGTDDDARSHTTVPMWQLLAMIAGGLAALVIGGEFTVRGAVNIATNIGISQTVIGLTLVAVGTSLPELATTVAAARRRETDIAVGNIVGSNVFNMLFIWGLTVSIAPTDVPIGGSGDLLVMVGFAAALLPMALSQRRLSRVEGGVLVLLYIAYIVWLALR